MYASIQSISQSEKEQIKPGRFINVPFPSRSVPQVSPFILLHHFGPFEVNRQNAFAFPPHPHRGFEAVTFLFEGEMQHRDSTGGVGALKSGDIQWMTAGSGIIHEEKQADDFLNRGGIIHGIQLWINLPAKYKMVLPKYQDISNNAIPVSETEKIIEWVIAGSYKNTKGIASTFTAMNVVLIEMEMDGEVVIPVEQTFNTCLYFVSGIFEINDQKQAKASEVTLFKNDGDSAKLKCIESGRVLLLSGQPIEEPMAQYGPFVMNTRDELIQAIDDYNNGRMGVME